MQTGMRKTQRKGTRSTQNVNRFKNTEKKMTLFEMFERFMSYKQTEGLAKPTIQGYYEHFHYLNDYLGGDVPNEEVTIELFREYIGYMLNDQCLQPTTVNVRIRTNRAFLRYCYQEGWIEAPIHEKFKPIKTPEDEIQAFTPAEVKSLLNQIDDSRFVGFRDKVMIYVLLDTMVRISELLNMKRCNVDLKSGYIKLEPHETKTKRTRSVPISTKTIKLIEEYLRESEDFGSEYLFVTYDGRDILSNTWRRRLTELGEMAGISNKRVSPHTFRHTGALFYIMNGGDPFSLQKILGHSDMSMVRKYIQMTDSDVKRQHNSFSPLKSVFGRR
ncbi:tyrosine-type recombinase/integrase [Neobacillus cucumis]|uniref:tyrosine-type recombinase/integrase n=1 Tax=Neobacillus cucumis TaxID=1740721 RepID=UPI002853424E|nr:tyrosine-type recombinase/integrase [Neobacillus cucumis]MDR4946500.1 tyrosine-type recombinase/integrase [Neobacillus cucumis]